MGLKGAGPYFQRSMASKVLAFRICELYIDDVLIHGFTKAECLTNLRKVFQRKPLTQEHDPLKNARTAVDFF